jgi:hypothetical protein
MTMTRPRRTPYQGMTGIAMSVVAAIILLPVGPRCPIDASLGDAHCHGASVAALNWGRHG